MAEIEMDPSGSGIDKHHNACLKAGYPYPIGPVIPRPDAEWQPLWPGLLKSNLKRHNAAAQVLVNYYRSLEVQTESRSRASQAGWRDTRGEMKTRLDLSFRNWWARTNSQHDPKAKGVNIPLKILDDWLCHLKGRSVKVDMDHLINDKLKNDFNDAYRAGRSNARSSSLLFAPPYYPKVGQDPQCVVGATPWNSSELGQQQYVKELLEQPAGEWNVLTLLFIKLLHTHMAWLAPKRIQDKRQMQYYRPILHQLRLCALQAGTPQAHPLAETAVGIWQNLRRVDLLMSTGQRNDLLFPEHKEDSLDPTDDKLPDCLHMGSPLWVTECVTEVKQILRWMDEPGGGSEWTALVPWVDDVADLAWEMASARTDPFAMGGLYMAGGNQHKTEQIFKRFNNGWQESVRGFKALADKLNGATLTERQCASLRQLPSRFRTDEKMPNAQIDLTIRAIENWAERSAQLRLYYKTICVLLTSHALNEYQSQN